MGLLERLKLNKTKDFFEWLDLILKNELLSLIHISEPTRPY